MNKKVIHQTRRLLELCFAEGYTKVVVESHHLYASPTYTKLGRKRKPFSFVPLWDVVRAVGEELGIKNLMGCGNGGMRRGDQVQPNENDLFYPGVYFSDQDSLGLLDEETLLVSDISRRMKGGRRLPNPNPICPHGGWGACEECFKEWEVFP